MSTTMSTVDTISNDRQVNAMNDAYGNAKKKNTQYEGEEDDNDSDDDDQDELDEDEYGNDGAMSLYSDFIEESVAGSNGGIVGSNGGSSRSSSSGSSRSHASIVPSSSSSSAAASSVGASRVHVGDFRNGSRVGSSVSRSLAESEKALDKSRVHSKDRSDRATSEQVLDPKTREMLKKMVASGILSDIQGCISTGKEANVYYGFTSKSAADSIKNGGRPTAKASTDAAPSAPSTSSSTSTSSTVVLADSASSSSSSSPLAVLPSSAVAAVPASSVPIVELAIKIYKTSILVFKDRDKYVTGEFRFRHGYCKSNPRKMVKLWAEKELRNLKRLNAAGIPSPEPVLLKNHVLIMTLIGEGGVAAPRLKNALMTSTEMRLGYAQLIRLVRRMYHDCKLIHADLSEYNLLYLNGIIYIIDVSQSVEHDHPQSMEFLKKDVENVTKFFQAGGVAVMSVQELFEFVMDPTISDVDAYLDSMQLRIAARSSSSSSSSASAEDHANQIAAGVFMGAPVIRRLDQLVEHENEQMKFDNKSEGFHQAIQAMTSGATKKTHDDQERDEDEQTEDESEEEDEEEDDEDESEEDVPAATVSKQSMTSIEDMLASLSIPTTSAAAPSSSSSSVRSAFPPSSSSSSSTFKPSAKAVHAPTVLATSRDAGASALFAGLLLPKANDQSLDAMTNESTSGAEPGYVSEGEDEDEYEDDIFKHGNVNHKKMGGRQTKHVTMAASKSDDDDDASDSDEYDDSDDDASESNDDDGPRCTTLASSSSVDAPWEDRTQMTPEAARAAKKEHKKQIKSEQSEKRKTKLPKKIKRAKTAAKKHKK